MGAPRPMPTILKMTADCTVSSNCGGVRRVQAECRHETYGGSGEKKVVGPPLSCLAAQPRPHQKADPDKGERDGDRNNNQTTLVIVSNDKRGGDDTCGHGEGGQEGRSQQRPCEGMGGRGIR